MRPLIAGIGKMNGPAPQLDPIEAVAASMEPLPPNAELPASSR